MPPRARILSLLFFVLALLPGAAFATETSTPTIDALSIHWPEERLYVGGTLEGLEIEAVDAQGRRVEAYAGPLEVEGLIPTASIAFAGGVARIDQAELSAETVRFRAGRIEQTAAAPILTAWLSLLPAFLAIALALITRQVLLSLFGGVWLGAWLLGRGPIGGFFGAIEIGAEVVADVDHAKIICFTLLMGGMVGVVGKSGGSMGIVDAVSRFAKTPRSGALSTWAMGMFIFFDDYASSLLVGSTMRPVTDRLNISREKLSYIVDSTAAPITSLAMISTWVGYEVSVLGQALEASGITRDPYEVFLAGIPSRFYQVLALAMVIMVAVLGRDFGPMLKAERRARKEGKPLRDGAEPLMDTSLIEEARQSEGSGGRWWLAVVPVLTLIGVVLFFLTTTGLAAGDQNPGAFAEASEAGVLRVFGFILSNADSYNALLYGAGLSALVAMALSMSVRTLSLKGAIDAFVGGVQAMALAVIVLCLAWSIGHVMSQLNAGQYVVSVVGEGIPAWMIPMLTFILAAVIALATGSSWGTIAILFPIAVPVVVVHEASPAFEAVLLGTTSSILGGAVFGDHCSPISDTTVLSSIACASDHMDHTRTQAPYAAVAAFFAVVLGYIPVGFGFSAWISMGVALVALFVFIRVFGKRPED